MKLLLNIVMAVCLLAGVSTAASAAYAVRGSGPNLVRRAYPAQPGESLSFGTSDCAGSEDTMMFLLEWSPGNIRTTAAWNDDSAGGFCSHVDITNTSSVQKVYELVITTYPGSPTANVNFTVFKNNVFQGSEFLDVRGVTTHLSPSGTSQGFVNHFTVGLPSGLGGRQVDTVLYVINPNPGWQTTFNDDDGMRELSSLVETNFNCSLSSGCWVVAGEYLFPGNGGAFEVWGDSSGVLGGPDNDFDGIENATEIIKGTNPNLADTDLDGLTDSEEFFGVRAASLVGNDASLVMPWQDTGADPLSQDLFVEVEYMGLSTTTGGGHTHDPLATGNWTTFVADMTAIFQNDAGFTGRTIRSHVMRSDSLTHNPRISFANCSVLTSTQFYPIKSSPSFFDPLRASIFHYVILGHEIQDTNCVNQTWGGMAEIWGNDVIVTTGGGTLGVGTVNDQRGTFIHELGHNFALVHNGNGNTPVGTTNSCVHSSVMNYRYQNFGWGNAAIPALRRFGYSNGLCPASGNGCGNTCGTNRCVPSSQTSPKTGCSTNNGSCDCDKPEWGSLALDIPGNGLMSYILCQANNCSGSSHGARHEMREFFRGEGRVRSKGHEEFAKNRRAFLAKKGLVEGVDFVVSPESGRTFSAE